MNPKKHYQLWYYDKLFNEDIFITENEEKNISYKLSKDAIEIDLENMNVNKSLKNNKVLEIEIKKKNNNSSSSPDLKLFNKSNISHENEMPLNPDKNEKNYIEPLNPMNKENKKSSTCKFEIKMKISSLTYNQNEKYLNKIK